MPALCLLTGCGLTLDIDPPDPVPDAAVRMDAASADAGSGDAGSADAGSGDAGSGVCGDGVVDPGEDCDDANDFDGDGCTGECRFTCVDDADCGPSDACTQSTCDVVAHVCVPSAIVCAEPAECERLVGCDAALGCVYEPLEERCDGLDQDCDGLVDEGAGTLCAQDEDEDGFGDPTRAATFCDGACPDGWVLDTADCWDGPRTSAASAIPGPQLARPGQRTNFSEPHGDGTGSFDWSCDGAEEPRFANVFSACSSAMGPCGDQSGWVGAVAPCGERRAYVYCSSASGGTCVASMGMGTQTCR